MKYALVRLSDSVAVREFDALPNPLAWPNGDITHAASAGDERDGHRLVTIVANAAAPNEFYRYEGKREEVGPTTITVQRVWTPIEPHLSIPILKARVDMAAERERQKFITPGAGQAMVYQQKLAEANAVQADGFHVNNYYPMLATSGYDIADTAKNVIAAAFKSNQAMVRIEAVRLAAKAALSKAATTEDALAIVDALKWDA